MNSNIFSCVIICKFLFRHCSNVTVIFKYLIWANDSSVIFFVLIPIISMFSKMYYIQANCKCIFLVTLLFNKWLLLPLYKNMFNCYSVKIWGIIRSEDKTLHFVQFWESFHYYGKFSSPVWKKKTHPVHNHIYVQKYFSLTLLLLPLTEMEWKDGIWSRVRDTEIILKIYFFLRVDK